MSTLLWVDEVETDVLKKIVQLLLWELKYTVRRDESGNIYLEKDK